MLVHRLIISSKTRKKQTPRQKNHTNEKVKCLEPNCSNLIVSLLCILSAAGVWGAGSPAVFTVPYSKYHHKITKLFSPGYN